MNETSARNPGILYIVATPIGNQKDISLRAIEILNTVDAVLAEDTRHSIPLLAGLGIKKPMISLHAHNESIKSSQILNMILEGKNLALISDAGTPLISDPGYLLVKQAVEQKIVVVPIPGACALIAALSAAGIPSDTFTFYGFLPAKSSSRREKLLESSFSLHTLIFYESTHRVLNSLIDIADVFGQQCRIVLAKELTKQFEKIIEGTCDEIGTWLRADPGHCKGEFVILIPPRSCNATSDDSETILAVLIKELPLKQAVNIASQITSTSKNILYKKALTLMTNKDASNV